MRLKENSRINEATIFAYKNNPEQIIYDRCMKKRDTGEEKPVCRERWLEK